MSKVTIIVPVYNVEKYLGRCLDSLLVQDYQDFEIICVNDKSPDGSQLILDDYVERYPEKIKILVNEENMGQGRSRIRALEHAQGEYVMFVDSDDYVAKDYIRSFMVEMKKMKSDVVVGGFTRDVEGRYTKHKSPGGKWSILVYAASWAKLYRKDFLVKNHITFSDIRCGEDIYFNLSLFYYHAKVSVIDYYGYYYYCNNSSVTKAMNYESNHEYFVSEIYNKFMADHDIKKLSVKMQRGIEYTYVANMVNALITYGHGCKPKRMNEKYKYVMEDMKLKFPDYKKNPFYGIMRPKNANFKVRIGVGVTMLLHKIHLEKLMLYIVSLI